MTKKLLPCLKGYGLFALLAPLTIILEVILEIFIPFLMSKIIDVGIATGDLPYITKMGILMALMAFLSLLAGVASGAFAAKAGAGFAYGIRKKVFGKVCEFSFANTDKFSTASLITRITTDVNLIQNTFIMIIRSSVRSVFMLCCATTMAFRLNGRLAFIFLAAIPVLGTSLYIISSKAHPRFRQMFKKFDLMNRKLQEVLIAIRVVKSFVRGEYETEEFAKAAEEVRAAQVRAEKLLIFNMPIMQFCMYACIVAICIIGGRFVVFGRMGTGELMGFISYVSQILMSLMMISMVFVSLVMSRSSMSRISEVLDEKIDIVADKTSPLTLKDGSIRFEDVSFSYQKDSENYVLKDINFEIKSGETIGIIGGTGSGKTSLISLIPRLYDISRGTLLVGGNHVSHYSLETLRSGVSQVLQNNVLFSGTILENLKWGNENATREEIEYAAKAACAHEFITSFPGGYETVLGQGGINLSGGQKQRLCIARALLKKPKILILDDSTSAVDTATDASIRKAFREMLPDVTKIIIAQRVTSVSDADRILILENGRVNAFDTPENLLQNNEIYQEIYNSQQKGAIA